MCDSNKETQWKLLWTGTNNLPFKFALLDQNVLTVTAGAAGTVIVVNYVYHLNTAHSYISN